MIISDPAHVTPTLSAIPRLLFGGNIRRMVFMCFNLDAGQSIGITFGNQLPFLQSHIIVAPKDSIICTVGDFGSVLASEIYATTDGFNPGVFFSEVHKVG